MTKRKAYEPPPGLEDPARREVVKGGLLAAAAALGLLPGCSDEGGAEGAAGSPGPGAGTPAAPSGGTSAAAGSVASGGAGRTAGPAGATANAAAGRPGASGGAGSAAGGSPGSANPSPGGAGSAAGQAGAVAANGGSGGVAGAPPTAAGDMVVPRAMLGKTGVMVPIVGLGTSRLGQRGGTPNQADFDNMVKVFSASIDMGIQYVDTGANYGRAEEALGVVLGNGRREKVFLTTKLFTDSYSQAKTLFERSLQRLKTDHVDLLYLHSAGDRNIDTVLGQNGTWRYILEQKMMGKARFIGITGHNNPPNFMRMLATDQVEVLMTIMNFVDHSTYGFSKTVREEAMKRDVGIMAMKVFGGTESVLRPGGGLANANSSMPHKSNMELSFNQSVLPDCIRFVKGLGGITGMVIGVNSIEEAEQNIRWAIETQPFNDTEMQAIIKMGEMMAPMWQQRYG